MEDYLKKRGGKGRRHKKNKNRDDLKKKIQKMEDDLNIFLNGKRHKKNGRQPKKNGRRPNKTKNFLDSSQI